VAPCGKGETRKTSSFLLLILVYYADRQKYTSNNNIQHKEREREESKHFLGCIQKLWLEFTSSRLHRTASHRIFAFEVKVKRNSAIDDHVVLSSSSSFGSRTDLKGVDDAVQALLLILLLRVRIGKIGGRRREEIADSLSYRWATIKAVIHRDINDSLPHPPLKEDSVPSSLQKTLSIVFPDGAM